ncbi:hypothetical protein GMORB2_5127 [Geosmithia morbida]|uniref:Uncharacterized protein n=1 Tax=Geosmithia morbida TaxID=1094350 RepID=A0A9P4YWN1_9HYPO|nr:uncharacterized protein GMORB2_5127 [Geosmithia morbida]KAF4124461.1 hypothetical protein GMORB2_5127 [Geosmithia morbida]
MAHVLGRKRALVMGRGYSLSWLAKSTVRSQASYATRPTARTHQSGPPTASNPSAWEDTTASVTGS